MGFSRIFQRVTGQAANEEDVRHRPMERSGWAATQTEERDGHLLILLPMSIWCVVFEFLFLGLEVVLVTLASGATVVLCK